MTVHHITPYSTPIPTADQIRNLADRLWEAAYALEASLPVTQDDFPEFAVRPGIVAPSGPSAAEVRDWAASLNPPLCHEGVRGRLPKKAVAAWNAANPARPYNP